MENYIWPEITKDTPLEEVKRIHKDIWNYVIKHGEKPETPYISNCVACECARTTFSDSCQNCPIIWPKNDDGKRLCVINNGLCSKWRNSTGEEKTELARQIRDLPWKFEVEKKSMYKVKTFLQSPLIESTPVVDQMNAFLKENPKVIPISISHGVSTTNEGIVIGTHAMLLYKEEE